MSAHYIYVIFRPNGIPCYVGKGTKSRMGDHRRLAKNRHLAAIYKAADGDLPVVKVREGLTNQEAIKIEIALIAAIGRVQNGGSLVNFTDGGEGTLGLIHTVEARAKISARHKGKKLSPEEVERLRRLHTGRKRSPETQAKITAGQKGQKRPLEFGEKMRVLNLGRKLTDEQRKKQSDAQRGRKQSAAAIEKLRNFLSGRPKSEEHCEKLRQIASSPEGRKRRSEMMKALWAERRAQNDATARRGLRYSGSRSDGNPSLPLFPDHQ